MGDTTYVYGESNGASYVDLDGDVPLPHKTHWDPRFEVKAIAGTVQIGLIPASENSTDETGLWDPEDGRFMSVSRSGINRMIVALREARDEAYGRDE